LSMMKGVKIGCLDQEMQSLHSDETVLEVTLEAFAEALQLRKEIDEMLQDPAINSDDKLIRSLSEKQQRLESMDGYNLESKASGILAGLGFSEHDQHQPFDTFSGGWRMRVHLARLLLTEPDLLLLDEPTNHLDLPSIQWLEDYLRNFRGAFIIVSHDRFFLDRLITSTVEVDQQRFNRYKGNYSYFLKEKVIRREQRQREYENQQKMISETERFINRFRAKATKARQVQSKIKMLEKIEKIEPPEGESATINFKFSPAVTPGKHILNLDVSQKAYGEKLILKNSKLQIIRGDKIALIGANGLGKSTALRMVAGTEPFNGDVKLGANVDPGFFAQHQLDALTPEDDIMGEMRSFIHKKGEATVRGILGGFLFTGDDVFKKIKVLSGGEKSRVALAKTLLAESNFLLLDEPTNHLDIQSIQILCKALQQYEGTYIIVSHDRYFLREIANKIWYIEDHLLKEYPGTFEEFEYHMQGRGKEVDQAAKRKKEEKAKPKVKSDYHAEKERKRKHRKIKSEFEKIEAQIEALEEKKKEMIAQMASPEMSTQYDKLADLQKEVDKIEKELVPANARWEELYEIIENENIEL
ncbi:MAG: ABC-F family ATP-binding cassette domain-containing protein, partial [Bacteroidota bacterium]